jgi:golgi-specific brefeldin A-resistance guanine nucleotide exchange factor 1
MNRKLNQNATDALMSALLAYVTIDAPDGASEGSASTPSMSAKDIPSLASGEDKGYDPTRLFLLEIATALAIRDEQTVRDHGAKVAGYCTEILRQRKHLHPILVERSLIYLMAIKKHSDQTVTLGSGSD